MKASGHIGEARNFGIRRLSDRIDDAHRFYEQVCSRIEAVSTGLRKNDSDPFGMNLEQLRKTAIGAAFLYRYYFRCETTGVSRIPEGPVLLVANHAGQIPIDAVMITVAMMLESDRPRLCRSLVDRWVHRLPLISTWYARVGIAIGTPENARLLLSRGAAILAFPEGMRGVQKKITEAYQLAPFGNGFIRLAIANKVPVVPVSVVGSEEQYPTLFHLRRGFHLMNMPPFPIWLHMGVPILGTLPLPVKYHIEFGEPQYFDGDPDDDDEVIARKADEIKQTIHAGIEQMLARRKSIFF